MRFLTVSRLMSILVLAASLTAGAFAQTYPPSSGGSTGTGNGTYTPPKGGYSSSTGIAIGAGAAAGVAIAYLALRAHRTVVGCIEPSTDGKKLMNEKDKNTYALVASNDLALDAGERVALRGKKVKDDSGKLSFQVDKLVKDYGSCKQ